jgi:hypothetical protein
MEKRFYCILTTAQNQEALTSLHREMGITKRHPEGLSLLRDKTKPQEAQPNANRETRKRQYLGSHSWSHPAAQPLCWLKQDAR